MKSGFPDLFYHHVGKITGPIIGLAVGLRTFGVIFGFICGVLVDIFLQEMRLRRSLCTADSLEHIARTYPSQLQGILKVCWLVIHAARFEYRGEFSPPDIHFLQALILRGLSLSVKGRALVKQIFGSFGTGQGRVPSREELSRLANPGLTPSEQVAVARLFYEAVSMGSGSSVRSAKASRYVRELCSGLGIEARYSQVAGSITRSKDNSSYELLGVNRQDSIREIKRVYRTLAAQFHPDSLHNLSNAQKEAATEAFVRISEAYKSILGERENTFVEGSGEEK